MSAATAAGWSRMSRRHWLRSIASTAALMLRPASAGSMISVPEIATCSTSGPAGKSLLALWRQFLEARHSLGDGMERLLVAGVDRGLRQTIERGVVKCAGFQDHRGQSRPERRQMSAAFAAEFTGDRAFKVAAAKLLRRACAVAETLDRHQHEKIGTAAGNVLAFPAMELPLEHGIAFGYVAHFPAIASAFEFHGVPSSSSMYRRRGCRMCVLVDGVDDLRPHLKRQRVPHAFDHDQLGARN